MTAQPLDVHADIPQNRNCRVWDRCARKKRKPAQRRFFAFLAQRLLRRGVDSRQQWCKACGRPDKFNFHVPDEVWREVVPTHLRNYVVCLYCFDDFAEVKGVKYAAHLGELYFAGKRATFRFNTDWSAD